MGERRPVLSQLNLVVRDMRASLAFYRRLGLDVPERAADTSGGHHAEVGLENGFVLELDSPELARAYNRGARDAGPSASVIGFSLPSREAVDALYAELIADGHTGSQPPYDAFWGARYAAVEDPDGHPVGLMSPSDPGRMGPPPKLS